MMLNQLEFLISGSEVKRYHTVRTLQEETVGHHSHGVAVLCKILNPHCNAELLCAALFHDLAEHELGDIPSPAKRKYGIGEQVNSLESQLLNDAGLSADNLSEQNARTLKFADIFQGMIFCLREIQLGNKRFGEIFGRYSSYASDMIPTGKEKTLLDILLSKYWKEIK